MAAAEPVEKSVEGGGWKRGEQDVLSVQLCMPVEGPGPDTHDVCAMLLGRYPIQGLEHCDGHIDLSSSYVRSSLAWIPARIIGPAGRSCSDSNRQGRTTYRQARCTQARC